MSFVVKEIAVSFLPIVFFAISFPFKRSAAVVALIETPFVVRNAFEAPGTFFHGGRGALMG